MPRRSLAPALALAALASDLAGAHGLALAALVLAIPAAFALGLECYGDALDDRCGRARPLLAGGGLCLLLLSAALRSPAVVGGVPRLAVTAVVLALVLYGAAAAGAVLGSAARPRRTQVALDPETERIAA
jgi:hypothetical protein